MTRQAHRHETTTALARRPSYNKGRSSSANAKARAKAQSARDFKHTVIVIVVGVVLLGLAGFVVWGFTDRGPLTAIFNPELYAQAVRNHRRELDEQAKNIPVETAQGAMLWTVVVYSCAFLVVVGAAAVGKRFWIWADRPNAVLDVNNGLLPLVWNHTGNPVLRIFGFGSRELTNPNDLITQEQQELGLRHKALEAAKTTGGKVSYVHKQNNKQLPPPKIAPMEPYRPPVEANPVSSAIVVPTVSQYLANSVDGKVWLGIRHQPKGNNLADNVAIWDTNEAAQFGVFGSNGCGKTASTGAISVLAAVKWDWHVVILDPKRGADWKKFMPHVELHDSGPDEMPGQLKCILTEMERRQVLNSKHGASHVNDLPANVRPRTLLLVLEELGDTRAYLDAMTKGKVNLVGPFDVALSKIMRVSRYVGVKVVLIDQRPEGWSGGTKANLKAIVTYKQGMHQGSAVGYYHAQSLANKGQFAMDNVVYDAPFVLKEVPGILASMDKGKVQTPGLVSLLNGRQIPYIISDSTPVSVSDTLDLPEPETYEELDDSSQESVQRYAADDSPRGRVVEYLEQHPGATGYEAGAALGIAPAYATKIAKRWREQNG